MQIPTFKLGNGNSIPAVGLGTWQSKPGEVAKAVEVALKAGYRHLDCAYAYGNEAEVGQGIKASGVPREEIFVTSKLWCTFHTNAEACIDDTLSNLGLDYLDLYLIHWPVALNPKGNDPKFPTKPDGSRDIFTDWDPCTQTWKQMEELLKKGKTKAIGVSNWSIPKLEKLLKHAEIPPAANQIELHPYLPQEDMLEYCKSKNILLEAYSPLGSTNSPLLTDETVVKIAKKHDTEVGTVLISYQVARGVVVLPKSVTPARIEKNLKLVKLDDEDVKLLTSLDKKQRFVKPAWGVPMEFADW